MSKFLELSVHALVDFVLRTGDIDSRVFNNETMMEGTRRHLLYQRQQNEDYFPEVTLDETFTYKDYSVRLYGRADGIIIQNNKVTIDEIKSTVSALDEFYENNKEFKKNRTKYNALQ